MAGEDQRVLFRPAAERDLTIVFDFDLVNTPVDKIKNRTWIGGVLIFFFRDRIKFVRHFIRAYISRLSRFGEITVERRNLRRVSIVVNEKVWTRCAGFGYSLYLFHRIS